ncbi:MAG: invasion associated locus B family protein [Sphingomonadaceae bacterium]
MRRLLLLAAVISAPAWARDSLGVYEGWGAFRDTQPFRCFAIAEPESTSGGKWKPFASVAHWPVTRTRGQIHVRLSRTMREGAKITLTIDDKRATMIGSGADVWAPSRQMDAAIVAAMRSGRSMSIETVAATGGGFADAYRLKGAASAIDAAALGCARAR